MKNLFFLIFLFFLTSQSFSGTDSTIKKNERVFLKDTVAINSFLWGGRILYVRNKDSKIFDTNANLAIAANCIAPYFLQFSSKLSALDNLFL